MYSWKSSCIDCVYTKILISLYFSSYSATAEMKIELINPYAHWCINWIGYIYIYLNHVSFVTIDSYFLSLIRQTDEKCALSRKYKFIVIKITWFSQIFIQCIPLVHTDLPCFLFHLWVYIIYVYFWQKANVIWQTFETIAQYYKIFTHWTVMRNHTLIIIWMLWQVVLVSAWVQITRTNAVHKTAKV